MSGTAKTRLIPLLGPRGAARFQAALLSDALEKLGALKTEASPYLFVAGRGTVDAAGFTIFRQRGTDLGVRLEDAFRRLLRRHSAAVIVGTDSPTLPPSALRAALDELRVCDAVLGPCPDGGYYLIGLRRLPRGMLRDIRWGTSQAFRDTLHGLVTRGLSCSLLEPLDDVDLPADFRRLANLLSQQAALRRRCPATWRFINASAGPRGFTISARSSLRLPLRHPRRILPPGRE